MSTLHTDIRRLILRSCKSNTAVLSKKSEDFTRNCGQGDFLIARYHGAGSVKRRVIEYLLINYRHDRNKFAILWLYFESTLLESSNGFFDQGQFKRANFENQVFREVGQRFYQ